MTLTPERWQQIDRVFEAALERPPEARAEWVQREHGADADLVERVLALLESARESEVLGESVSGYAADVIAQLREEAEREAGTLPLDGQVGVYRLLREVGRGGMGTVYLAERADAQYEKRVALKLVRRGMDTDEVLLRFRYERQILASLEHPNIARLYDGGAASDGRPYLVMEYVEGQPILAWCDARRLGIEPRLRLFVAVCDAVSYAHRNLVVHRDIKPSNILVADGTPKLLDFGIARLLDPAEDATAPRTRTGLHLLTPEYASPEQRRGLPITTATDVYSLGLVLYELLTGERPQPESVVRPGTVVARAADDSRAALRESTRQRLAKRLRGDLDTIVLRALSEDPARRYPSAEHLAADIARHLDGLPVLARGDSLRYRASRFVQRHRGAVAAAALVVLSLVTGLAAALWQADRAARERDQARLERQRAEEVSGFLVGLFESADPFDQAGADTLRVRSIVDRGAARVREELAEQPQLRGRLLKTLGQVYTRLGLYDPAAALLQESVHAVSADGALARERAEALAALIDVAQRRTDPAAMDTLGAQVIALYDSAGWAPDPSYLNALSHRATALEARGETDQARELHELALARVRELEPVRGVHYARLLNNLAVHHANLEQYAEAEPLLRESIGVERGVLGERHPAIAEGLNNLASAVHHQGRHEEAESLYREAIDIARESYGPDHPHVAQFSENLATLFDDLGRHADAQPLYADALRIVATAHGEDGVRTALLQRNYALNRQAAGDYAAAESLLRAAARSLQAALGGDHPYTALAETSLGRTLTSRGRASEALPLLRRGLETLGQHFPADHWRLQAIRSDIGAALGQLGQRDEAESMLIAAYESLLAQRGAGDYTTKLARAHLHRFYTAGGAPDRAAAYAPDTT